jgi:hypothetical protein
MSIEKNLHDSGLKIRGSVKVTALPDKTFDRKSTETIWRLLNDEITPRLEFDRRLLDECESLAEWVRENQSANEGASREAQHMSRLVEILRPLVQNDRDASLLAKAFWLGNSYCELHDELRFAKHVRTDKKASRGRKKGNENAIRQSKCRENNEKFQEIAQSEMAKKKPGYYKSAVQLARIVIVHPDAPRHENGIPYNSNRLARKLRNTITF